ncbi:gas vesicle protein [halophilic archaeon]|nr:gas vesicle protein [halophilic archaeon]
MKPTKDDHAAVELLDVLLREGAIVQADVVVTVADVPLVGVSLRAAIAGMSTMTDYGYFEEWDAVQRERALDEDVERSLAAESSGRALGEGASERPDRDGPGERPERSDPGEGE